MARTLFRPRRRHPSERTDAGEPVRSLNGEHASPKPVARFAPGKVAASRQRNLGWLLGGVLLVLVCALAGVLLVTAGDDRVDVVVAAADLEPGRRVERSDLRVTRVRVDAGVATVTPTAAAELIGRVPLGEIPEGSMLSAGMFSETQALGAGEVVVGAALDPGEAPMSAIEPGTPVELLHTPKSPAAGEADPPAGPTPRARSLGAGTVWTSELIGTGQLWLTVRVPESVGLAAAQASQDDALRIVLSGGDG